MKLFGFLLLALVIMTMGIIYLYNKSESNQPSSQSTADSTESSQEKFAGVNGCVPAFADGGGPYYKPNSPFREKLSPQNSIGTKLSVEGKVFGNDCVTAIPGAVLDIWQADETGTYPEEWFRGKVTTDKDGIYKFETIVPKGYGAGTGYRPPHIHFKVFVDERELVTSQIFFPESKGLPGFDDAYIMSISESEGVLYGYHDIFLP